MCPMIVMHVPWAHDDGETGVEESMQVLTQKNYGPKKAVNICSTFHSEKRNLTQTGNKANVNI